MVMVNEISGLTVARDVNPNMRPPNGCRIMSEKEAEEYARNKGRTRPNEPDHVRGLVKELLQARNRIRELEKQISNMDERELSLEKRLKRAEREFDRRDKDLKRRETELAYRLRELNEQE